MSRVQLPDCVCDFDAAVAFCPGAVCGYARQVKAWVRGPDGVPWEYCTVLEPIELP